MTNGSDDPRALLERSLESDRLHSAYLISGSGSEPREAALEFVRGMVCGGGPRRPCEACAECRRSNQREQIVLDGTGRNGPLLRHVGDHPDLLWVERGAGDTRVRIAQVRAVQNALRLGANEGGWRALVVADAEWLNQEAQNALLRLLEEPPPRTCLILVTASAAGLLATIRSRCQRVRFPAPEPEPLRGDGAPEAVHALCERLDRLHSASLPALLDWAEEYRGERSAAAERVQALLETGGGWLRERVRARLGAGDADLRPALGAWKALQTCRKELVQRNANPQMVAERALLALQRVPHQADRRSVRSEAKPNAGQS
jgi:DNA polymerase III delta prime subunit